ncbi:GNAT family N-acetyltransferase [Thalassotalea sp. PP2-459]|uniref:GNAT family N-acetyltransferase n=1 Tax=Thalassotalea sp. PP2-459 TaxID=1742724 RepID=UPI000941D72F|nr:GNAT family N-acetyltransferase [Thalassotalea sp. PP2-459]OKY26049.1 GNAT family N-acetyltransferase [Thalassotalea sp. PP2-459]
MLNIKKMSQITILNPLKGAYFKASTSPLDGMWHFGFVPMAEHFGFYENESLIGFCCLNDDKYLLQFYLSDKVQVLAKDLFTLIVNGESAVIGEVNGAFVSTAEPQYLSLCLDSSSTSKVNALMYQHSGKNTREAIDKKELVLAKSDELALLVDFANNAIGAPKEWLTGYFGNLIQRHELWYYSIDGKMIATGECRYFDEFQTQYADVGMIVSPDYRGQGIATQVLNQLVKISEEKGRKAICSTESGNIGAQKAIRKAGFVAPNRILQFDFTSN